MAVSLERAREDGRRRLPARVRRGAAADLGILADRQRALRSAHRKETLRTDRRRRNSWRLARRPSRGAGGGAIWRAVHAAVAGRAPGGRRCPGASPRRRRLTVDRHALTDAVVTQRAPSYRGRATTAVPGGGR